MFRQEDKQTAGKSKNLRIQKSENLRIDFGSSAGVTFPFYDTTCSSRLKTKKVDIRATTPNCTRSSNKDWISTCKSFPQIKHYFVSLSMYYTTPIKGFSK